MKTQDANDVMIALIRQQTGAQTILTGDDNQSIYGFRGATNALIKFDFPEYPLMTSWRFGPEIARLAKSDSQGQELSLGAHRRRTVRESDAQRREPTDGHSLSRSNAGMVDAALEQLAAGRKVAILGGADAVASMIEGAYSLFLTGKIRPSGVSASSRTGAN